MTKELEDIIDKIYDKFKVIPGDDSPIIVWLDKYRLEIYVKDD